MEKYAKVITDNLALKLDRPFIYRIPNYLKEEISVGMRVLIPFGKGNRIIKGLVVEINDTYGGNYELKEIISILDNEAIVSKDLIKLSSWLRYRYVSSYISSLKPVLPPGNFKDIKQKIKIINKNYKTDDELKKKLMKILKYNKYVYYEELQKKINSSNLNKALKELEDLEVISIELEVNTRKKIPRERMVRITNKDRTLNKTLEIIGNRAKKQREIIKILYKKNEISLKELLIAGNTNKPVVDALESKGLIEYYFRDKKIHIYPEKIEDYSKFKLTKEQEYSYNFIKSKIKSGNNNKFLLHGVTGSGKTEIYLQVVELMLSLGKDSIILVPEISLTPQTIERFVGRFKDKVAVYHSKLNYSEKLNQWKKIKSGEVKIVVGARSAVFAPFKNLGMIILDEEHENTYKSSNNPRYDTREVAEKRIQIENANLILGTATPSLSSYKKAKDGDYYLLELTKRVNSKKMPNIKLVDMRKELLSGNKSIFSRSLYSKIKESLDRKEQVILFLNRRGFSTFVSCRNCGYVETCKNCDISLTFHQNINRLRCHYCGITKEIPYICPECGSKYIKYFGIGTEQVELFARKYFPNANIMRMDADTTTKKDSHIKILKKMKDKKIDILVGTQMIAKGLDFSNVSLVGIIAADMSLNIPDYNSAEKTFQLITQASGRTGRGEKQGNVILQTYEPEHYSINFAKNLDYNGFIEKELILRKTFKYPPYYTLFNIIIYGDSLNNVINISKKIGIILGSEIHYLYNEDYKDYIIGPNPAPLAKIKNNHRYQIILKTKHFDSDKIRSLLYRICISNNYNLDLEDIKIQVDINPNSIL